MASIYTTTPRMCVHLAHKLPQAYSYCVNACLRPLSRDETYQCANWKRVARSRYDNTAEPLSFVKAQQSCWRCDHINLARRPNLLEFVVPRESPITLLFFQPFISFAPSFLSPSYSSRNSDPGSQSRLSPSSPLWLFLEFLSRERYSSISS